MISESGVNRSGILERDVVEYKKYYDRRRCYEDFTDSPLL